MSRFIGFLIFVSTILIVVDLYSFMGVRQLTASLNPLTRKIIRYSYWIPSLITLLLFVYIALRSDHWIESKAYAFFYLVAGFTFLFLIPKIFFVVFHFMDDITHFFRWAFYKVQSSHETPTGEGMTRLQFFNRLGLAVSAVTFGSVLYGITKGKFAFRVEKADLEFEDLPNAFDGTTIVHISDIHIGSFLDNYEEVEEGVKLINSLNADYVFFTGDMVNNFASEAESWIDIIGGIQAKEGKFSIFGNHDYSDYQDWTSDPEGKKANLERLKEIQRLMGFRLLLNENVALTKGDQSIRLLGLENWGNHGFSRYGDFRKTMSGVQENEFKILMSHDPTHWEEEVNGKVNVHLTLSGHTHGMQFGLELPSLGIKLSPSSLRYKRWGGLYTENNQHLYVNRGFGFLGFPGRVGMPPEITLITLKKK